MCCCGKRSHWDKMDRVRASGEAGTSHTYSCRHLARPYKGSVGRSLHTLSLREQAGLWLWASDTPALFAGFRHHSSQNTARRIVQVRWSVSHVPGRQQPSLRWWNAGEFYTGGANKQAASQARRSLRIRGALLSSPLPSLPPFLPSFHLVFL